ncbi:hypothetical protein L2K70_00920 [Nocardioides KLBMP 9356]|uniref:DUF4232 domain-containing protein n=1 Tax=Nocardioides potassii TaxID=2911371 RepID=A0ABS9H4K7_9ACTN|nr:hypothetical protein [Nocardioides potassii]MCF6376162.1 hypothetical protein [Nocardioides potassii]
MTTTADAVRRWVRPAAFLVLLVAGVVLMAGCGDEGEPVETSTEGGPGTPSQDAPRPDVDFVAEVTPGAEAIAVSWTLTNTSQARMLVVDRVPRASGAGLVQDPQATYVVGGEGRLVQLTQRLYDEPETTMSFAQPPTAGATELGPGETLQRDLAVPLPLERLSPWGNDLGDGPIELPDPVTSVQFCLGVLAGDPQPSWGPGAEGDVVVLDHGSPAVAAQHVLCSDPTPVG